VAEFPDEEHGEDLSVGELRGSGSPVRAGRVAAAETGLHPIVDETVDHEEEILPAEAVRQ
jgi:hypothetical protein